MSYADVAKQNVPPLSDQAHPDPALLNTTSQSTDTPASDHKVTVAPADYKVHPKVAANRIAEELAEQEEYHDEPPNATGSSKRRARKEKAREAVEDAEEEGKELWGRAKSCLLRPGVAGGLLGIVNIGLLSTIGYQLYTRPSLRQDARFLSTSAIGTLVLFGAEGYAAEAYRQTEAGALEERRAREDGAAIFKRTKDIVLRPGVLGGLVGVFNVGILSGVGYWSYVNWDRPPAWGRREISATVVALLALFAGEGYLGEVYKENNTHGKE